MVYYMSMNKCNLNTLCRWYKWNHWEYHKTSNQIAYDKCSNTVIIPINSSQCNIRREHTQGLPAKVKQAKITSVSSTPVIILGQSHR